MDPSEQQLEAQVSADLAQRIRTSPGGARNVAAEEELVRRYGPALLRLLKRRTGDVEAARDLRQDTFIVALEKLRAGELDNPERIAAYLRGIADRLATAQYRKDRRRATTPDSEMIEREADQRKGPFEDVSDAQTARSIRTLLASLPTPRDRDILMSFYVREEDKEEICARLNLDSAHFNRVLFRAKQRLRELLSRKGPIRIVLAMC